MYNRLVYTPVMWIETVSYITARDVVIAYTASNKYVSERAESIHRITIGHREP